MSTVHCLGFLKIGPFYFWKNINLNIPVGLLRVRVMRFLASGFWLKQFYVGLLWIVIIWIFFNIKFKFVEIIHLESAFPRVSSGEVNIFKDTKIGEVWIFLLTIGLRKKTKSCERITLKIATELQKIRKLLQRVLERFCRVSYTANAFFPGYEPGYDTRGWLPSPGIVPGEGPPSPVIIT